MLEMPKSIQPTVLQRCAVAKALLPRARTEARKRRRLAKRAQFSACAMDVVAAHVGWSGTTLAKALAVIDVAKRDPRGFRDLVAKMDETGHVHRAYLEMRKREGKESKRKHRDTRDSVSMLIDELGSMTLAKAEDELAKLRTRTKFLEGLIARANCCEPPSRGRFLNMMSIEVVAQIVAAVQNNHELR